MAVAAVRSPPAVIAVEPDAVRLEQEGEPSTLVTGAARWLADDGRSGVVFRRRTDPDDSTRSPIEWLSAGATEPAIAVDPGPAQRVHGLDVAIVDGEPLLLYGVSEDSGRGSAELRPFGAGQSTLVVSDPDFTPGVSIGGGLAVVHKRDYAANVRGDWVVSFVDLAGGPLDLPHLTPPSCNPYERSCPTGYRLSDDGQRLVVQDGAGQVVIRDTVSGRVVASLDSVAVPVDARGDFILLFAPGPEDPNGLVGTVELVDLGTEGAPRVLSSRARGARFLVGPAPVGTLSLSP